MLYRYAPDRTKAQLALGFAWRYCRDDALARRVVGFSVYVANFNSYDKTYGSLGRSGHSADMALLVVLRRLLGAVINAQAERQTTADSTTGQPQPMGSRRAYAADTIGEIPR